jgi:hypothetical protein
MYALTREKVKGGDNGQVYNKQINGSMAIYPVITRVFEI